MSTRSVLPVAGGTAVATGKKPKPNEKPSETERQINIRCGPRLAARLQAVAEGLGLDLAPLVRMVLTEQLPIYERRVERLKHGEPPTN
jgi:hypothetical protein